MLFPLILCLLATCVTLGLSLSCETCAALKDSCTGTWQTCPPEKDSCGFIQMEKWGSPEMEVIIKTCIQSYNCALPLSSINMGKAGRIRIQVTCCEESECQEPPPSLPPLNRTSNGKRCPACYTAHSHRCEEEMAECAGDEDHCAEIFGSADLGWVMADRVMKGCVTASFCNKTRNNETIGVMKVVSKTFCTLATGAASFTPAPSGFLLQAAMGLLLGKVLV